MVKLETLQKLVRILKRNVRVFFEIGHCTFELDSEIGWGFSP